MSLLTIWCAAPLRAQTNEVSDASRWASQRLIQAYTFEETDDAGVPLGRTQPMPMHWYGIGRAADTGDPGFHNQPLHQQLQATPGFPHYGEIGFAQDQAKDGNFSLGLAIDGGSAGAFVEIGALAAIPGSEYLVEATIQTQGLTNARAYLEAYLVDTQGQVIEASRTRSQPMKTDGQWQPVSVQLSGRFTTTAWIGIEAKLLQPEPDAEDPLGRHQIILHDVTGNAWFDDVRIWQVPTVDVRTQSPTRILRAPIKPELQIGIRDLTGNRLLAQMTATNETGRVVDQATRVIGGGAPTQWRWQPKLPRYGYYNLQLEIQETQGAHRGVIERVDTDIVWVPETTPTAVGDLKRFVLNAQSQPESVLDMVPDILDQLGLFGVTLSLWEEDATLATAEDRVTRLDALAQPLLSQGRRIDMSLYPVPHDLIDATGPEAHDPIALLNKTQDTWLAYAGPVFRLFGQRVNRWVLGSIVQPEAFDSLQQGFAIDPARRTLSEVVASPTAVIPWSMLQAAPANGLASNNTEYTLAVDPSIPVHALSDYLAAWPADRTGVYLEPMHRGESTQTVRIADLIQRMAMAWQQEVASVSLPPVWRLVEKRQTYLRPDPLLAVFAQTAHRLAGRRVVGEMNLVPGTRCLILETAAGHSASGKTGMLIAWNESGHKDATLDLNLGGQPVAIDPWGNRRELKPVDGTHRIPLSQTPVFIENIDANLALLRANFRLDDPFIPASQKRHARKLILHNPWPFTITGTLTIREPETWLIQPARHRFSVAAGEDATLDIGLAMPVSEVAGPKPLVVDMDLHAGKPMLATLQTPMEVGLETVDVDASLSISESLNGGDPNLITSLTVKNTGDEPQSFYAFASLYGNPRQEQFIATLQPGETTIRRFYFNQQAARILNHAVRAGIRQARGPAMLNVRLTREDLE